jgi:hypothetical protein
MKQFKISNFPKFVEYAYSNPELNNLNQWDEILAAAGFKTAIYKGINSWCMDDEEYTWFVLRWS